MTADAANGSGRSDASFEAVDSKLTIYALANGMDLEKGERARRLTWFREGLDRGILLEAGVEGAVHITALAWKGEDEGEARRSPVAEAVPAAELARGLSEILERAMDAANAL